MTADTLHTIEHSERERQAKLKDRILCCTAAGCLAGGARAVRDAVQVEIDNQHKAGEIEVCGTGCMGPCREGPLVRSAAFARVFARVRPADARALVAGDHSMFEGRTMEPDHPFYAGQQRLVLANSGHTDPERLDDYISTGGYQALLAATKMTPEDIVSKVKRSGLRGRCGTGYPTGIKWERIAHHPSPVKYVVCNAGEDDSGGLVNCTVLESDPHRVLEGMAIAGIAVGAQRGYVWAHVQSPLAIARMRTAIEQANAAALLKSPAFDGDFHFRIDLCVSARACRSARLEGQPALIDSVEAFANIPSLVGTCSTRWPHEATG